ncbi:hypothetical protein [Desulfurococcus mucosus]|uniref:hypothetical protein n=1 Tax=Desulfurococcus mucosus TaxID=2275 RepID=UPI001FE2213B|nr:hypothetical protein [Desulfurococcus mucosus]
MNTSSTTRITEAATSSGITMLGCRRLWDAAHEPATGVYVRLSLAPCWGLSPGGPIGSGKGMYLSTPRLPHRFH